MNGNDILKRALQGADPVDLDALRHGVIRTRVAELETRCLIQSIAFDDTNQSVLLAVTGGDTTRLQNGKQYTVVVYEVLLTAEDTQS